MKPALILRKTLFNFSPERKKSQTIALFAKLQESYYRNKKSLLENAVRTVSSVYFSTHLLYLITHQSIMKKRFFSQLLKELLEIQVMSTEIEEWKRELYLLGYSSKEELFEDVKEMKKAEKARAIARIELYKRLAAQKGSSNE